MENNLINLNETVLSDGLTILYFSAPWCGPCKVLSPIMNEIGETNKDNINLVKINIDENQDLALSYGIRGVPTVLFFKNGEQKDNFIGVKSINEIQEKIDLLN